MTLSGSPEASLRKPEVSTSRAGRAPAAIPRAARCVPRLVADQRHLAEFAHEVDRGGDVDAAVGDQHGEAARRIGHAGAHELVAFVGDRAVRADADIAVAAGEQHQRAVRMGRRQQRRLDAADADRRLFDSARRFGRPVAEKRAGGNDGEASAAARAARNRLIVMDPGPVRLDCGQARGGGRRRQVAVRLRGTARPASSSESAPLESPSPGNFWTGSNGQLGPRLTTAVDSTFWRQDKKMAVVERPPISKSWSGWGQGDRRLHASTNLANRARAIGSEFTYSTSPRPLPRSAAAATPRPGTRF